MPMASRSPRPRSSSRIPHKLGRLFAAVYWLVTKKFSNLERVHLQYGCSEIADRKTRPGVQGRRAFMHVGHVEGRICVTPEANRLAPGFLLGMFLHEFGHIGSGGDDTEADRWVFEHFGIPVTYRGPLTLEWVSDKALRRAWVYGC